MEGTTTILTKMDDEVAAFLSMPAGVAKNIQYYGSFNQRGITESNIVTDTPDGKIYYSWRVCKIKKNNQSFYLRAQDKVGFTVEPNGKMNIWYGKTIHNIVDLTSILTHLKIDWLTSNLYMTNFMTKTILGKIIVGKITNPEDLFKAVVKSNRLKCSHSLLRQVTTDINLSKIDILRASQIAEDLNHWLEYKKQLKDNVSIITQDMSDLEQQALILNKKINYRWSVKRVQEVHKEWTKLIMDEEMKTIEDVMIDDIHDLDVFTPKEYTLLKSKKEIFLEGKIMNHCIYTNYWNRIKDKRYLVYHIRKGEQEGTLGIHINLNDKTNSLSVDQIRSRHNASVTSDIVDEAKQFVSYLSKQIGNSLFFKNKRREYISGGGAFAAQHDDHFFMNPF